MGSVSVSQAVGGRGVEATISWSTGPTVTVKITGTAGYGAQAHWRIRGQGSDTTHYIADTDASTGTFEAVDGKSYAFQAIWGSVSDGAVFTVNFDKPRTFTIVQGTGASVTCSRSNGSTVYDGDTFTVTANTVTGYNQNLSNMSFEQKRDRKSKDKSKEMGYRNGLYLNTDVVCEDTWTIDKIKARTDRMVNSLLEMFAW